MFICVEQFIEQLVEQAEKLTNNGNASPVGQESSAGVDESGENIQDKGQCIHLYCKVRNSVEISYRFLEIFVNLNSW